MEKTNLSELAQVFCGLLSLLSKIHLSKDKIHRCYTCCCSPRSRCLVSPHNTKYPLMEGECVAGGDYRRGPGSHSFWGKKYRRRKKTRQGKRQKTGLPFSSRSGSATAYPNAAIWPVRDTYPNAAIWLVRATYHSTC